MQDPLFSPIDIGGMTVKNRIYMPAMHLNMADDYQVTERMIAFYAARAEGGVGMIAVGFATVDELSGSPLNIGAHDDRFIPGLQKLSTAVNAHGARSVLQLNHAGRYNFSFLTGGRQPVAPSPLASRLTKETPRELSVPEIEQIVAAFAAAAARARAAGFDAVEVLSGTGYLISEFLSPLTNQRSDQYGGSKANRMRFGLSVVSAVKEALGDKLPLIVRMNGNDFMPGGQGRQALLDWARKLDENGVDALCINVGWHEARVPQIVASVPRGIFAYLAGGIRREVNVPVIASHRINDPMLARELIADDLCDMVAMGRPLIADPRLPEKAGTGREAEIVHCIACAQGCFDHIFKGRPVACLCNPKAGYETERTVAKAHHPRKVMVIGGGAAGMSAALAARERGHDVALYEKTEQLGGQLHLAAAPPGRAEFAVLARDLAFQTALNGVRVLLNQTVDEALLKKERPDAVVLATGALPLVPPVGGVDLPHVVQAWDVLQNRVYTGKRVVVIGGGAVGVETALFLADKGTLSADAVKFLLVNQAESSDDLYRMATTGTKKIVLVEMMKRVGKDIGLSTRWGLMQDLKRFGVKTLTATKALHITETAVVVETDAKTEKIPADSVVLAMGAASHSPLLPVLQKLGIPFTVAGDAGKVGLAFDAVHGGFAAGSDL